MNIKLPPRITDKWISERTDEELQWLAADFSGTCNGLRFDNEIKTRADSASKPNHGGKRKGSGRKPSGRKPYLVRMKPENMAKLKQKAGSKAVGEYLECVYK